MSSITFKIDDKKKMLLEETAKSLNVSVDELMNEALDNYMKEKEERFQAARAYVRERYLELYKRLA
ncbi:MAG: DNA-binding protein [Lewinellaceae bacterium]|nr:DNA-binding protein [Lewinellaceae bacterium]